MQKNGGANIDIKQLMKCGHTAQAMITNDKGEKRPYCVICDCDMPANNKPNLTGRVAHCTVPGCKNAKPSKDNLPFFAYKPDEAHDSYYCGCEGWD